MTPCPDCERYKTVLEVYRELSIYLHKKFAGQTGLDCEQVIDNTAHQMLQDKISDAHIAFIDHEIKRKE